ncbi:MAG: hypothetical protein J0I34_01185 [Pseudonocardia sp.]|uniref:hypothetical protein n=1 Tax=unclassified Pseudonocardia TaxID=2619320 RepID=UPI001AC78CC2|nr:MULTISPECIES: hypothetical protein [unclassified Pseudonocardia]MBN9107369.1 hypothetical protein [Pseudonocardia sp.]
MGDSDNLDNLHGDGDRAGTTDGPDGLVTPAELDGAVDSTAAGAVDVVLDVVSGSTAG